MSREQEHELEKKNRIVASITTIGIHTAMLLLLLFVVAFKTPDPPMTEYGVELNFGLDNQGYGEVQPESPIGDGGAAQAEDSQPTPEETQPQEVPEEVVEEKVKTKAPDPVPVKEEEVESTEESPVIVKKEPPKEKKKEEVKAPPVEKPKEEKKVEEKQVEEKKPVVEEKKVEEKPKVIQPKAVYKPAAQQSESGAEGGTKAGAPGNHGDDPGTVGDKGSPQGKLEAKALYGKPGSGGGNGAGNGVSMSGFNGFEWPSVSSPTLPDEAFGVYEFMVKVDDQGDVISVTPLQRGLSLEAERKFKEVIQRLVFVPKGSNLPPVSEGKITFKVVSK